MKQHAASRLFGSCVIAGIPLTLILWVTLELLRSDYNPFRNLLGEYLAGPFSILGTAAACLLAATFLALLAGLQLSVRPSGFLVASSVLLGVVVISLCVSALFPLDATPPDGGRLACAGAGIIHILSPVRFYALLMALLLTLPVAYQRDEQWRPLSRVTLLLGVLILALQAGFILAPFYLRGLVQRGIGLVILAWLVLTALRLRQATPSARGPVA